jgi:rhamnogalacturonyl hydrolase YesR
MTATKFKRSFKELTAFCEAEEFKGYDPYDGLNSRLFQKMPFIPKSRFMRLVWIQFFKRSPINFRKIVGVKKEYNPKALGLFLSGYCNLYKTDANPAHLEKMQLFIEQIYQTISKGYSGACWGYNFDWEARAFFQPKGMPTVVASSFIANALLDAYDITGEAKLLSTARSTCDFMLKDLNRTYDEKGNFSFSYSPLDKSVVFNASLLGSRLLARVYAYTKEQILADEAKRSVVFCCDYQQENGAWAYGTLPFHQWIDNFHTGYNLECIDDYMKYTGDESFRNYTEKGFDYYIHTFFTEEGIPKYYSNSIYPVDIHAPSQLIITVKKMGKTASGGPVVDKVINWSIDNMQDKKGYFYYQVNKYFTSRIPYMRWSQAWMFYAYSVYFLPKAKNV